MKVKDLIAALQDMDGEMEVVIPAYEQGFSEPLHMKTVDLYYRGKITSDSYWAGEYYKWDSYCEGKEQKITALVIYGDSLSTDIDSDLRYNIT